MNKESIIKIIILITVLLYRSADIYSQDWIKKQYDSLITVLPDLKEDSTKAGTLMSIAWNRMGHAQSTTGNYDEAINWGLKALKLCTKTNYRFGIGRCNHILGQCYMQKGNYTQSIKYHSAALKASFINGRKVLTAVSYNEIGLCYFHLGKYDEALINYQLALPFAVEANAFDLQEIIPMRMGETYQKIKNYTKAISWYEKALQAKTKAWTGNIKYQIALIQIEQDKNEEALKNLLEAQNFFPKYLKKPYTDVKGYSGELYLNIGAVYLKLASIKSSSEKLELYKQAVEYLNKAITLLIQAGKKENLINAYSLLKESYKAIGDYRNALYFTNQYIMLRDSLYNKTTYLQLADQRMQFEREKRTAEEKNRLEKMKLGNEILQQHLLAEEEVKRERLLTNEKLNYEKKISEEKLQTELAIAEEKSKYKNYLNQEKQKQEILKSETARKNSNILMAVIMATIISVLLILLFRQKTVKTRAIEKAEALHKLAELELQSLRTQLNPHFMFNSLNSIQELILLEENEKSHTYLSRFSKLLRMLLENAEKPLIPVKKEIDFLQLYLGLENLRVPELHYSISTDPLIKLEEILIPNMILQPYIENAIWHGLAHKEQNKQLQIRIFREYGTVNYEIEDNGVGRKRSAELKSVFKHKHQSKGMELLSKRFRLLNEKFSSDIQTTISDVIKNNEVSGTLVRIKVPVEISTLQFN